MSGLHRAAPGGRKSSARQGAAQVVIGIAVSTGKIWTAEAEERFDFGGGRGPREQLPGDPQIHDAPVRLGKAFEDPQSLHPVAVGVRRPGRYFETRRYPSGADAPLGSAAWCRRRQLLPSGFEQCAGTERQPRAGRARA